MTPAARIAAAIEILDGLFAYSRPATLALKDWGIAHRFAGSKDRAAINGLVYDALRVRASAQWLMGADTGRAAMLGALVRLRGLDADALAALFSGERHAPDTLADTERERLATANLDKAPEHVRADIPEWLAGSLKRATGADFVAEGQSLAARAPVDVRVNLLKNSREEAGRRLAHLAPQETQLSPVGLRFAVGPDGRGPVLSAETAYARGYVEVQDEGSQLVSLLAGAAPGQQVLDLCAGGGGKSLAMAAAMENRGQIYATDRDGRRLMPLHERLQRAGARNIQVRAPKGGQDVLAGLEERCDLVFVDAPCTGTGTWRRNPDAKWRVRPGALAERMKEQDEVLATAAKYVKPGGRLAYVTCSLLCEENEDRIAAFMAANPHYLPVDVAHLARQAAIEPIAGHASPHGPGLRLSPLRTSTDGFYMAVLTRIGG